MISGIATLSLELPPGSTKRRGAAPSGVPAVLHEFLLGPENWLVRQGIGWPAEEPAQLEFCCNPLVFYGPTGRGKSQLLQALAATWSRQQLADPVLLMHAVDFARGYAAAVKLDDVARFQQRYQLAGLVLLDDVDALEPKRAAQQQLAAIIDHRVRAQRSILLTARQPLTAQKLSPRLISRLAGGLQIPLRSPASETRREIIRRFASQRPQQLSAEAEQLLVDQRSLTVAQLMGVLSQLGAAHHDASDAGPQEIGTTRLRQLLGETPTEKVEPKAIIRLTAKHFGLPVRNLTGSSRRKMDVLARSLAMYLIRQLTDASFQQIGCFFGRRDHSTVMHACRKIRSAQDTDAAIRAVTVQLQQRLASNTAPLLTTPPGTTSRHREWG